MSGKKLSAIFAALLAWALFCSSCTYKLSLDGASIPVYMKSVRVDYFENNAPLVVNYLSQQFTEALKDRIRSTTSLRIVTGEADAEFSGQITGYSIAPVSIQATSNNTAPIAGASALTITVSVKYTVNPPADHPEGKKLSFNETFSKSANFSGDISSVEQNLITTINKQLTEDIFNKAFANW